MIWNGQTRNILSNVEQTFSLPVQHIWLSWLNDTEKTAVRTFILLYINDVNKAYFYDKENWRWADDSYDMVTERMIIMDMILVMATDNDRIMIIVIKNLYW